MRPRLITLLVLAVGVAATVIIVGTARRVVDDSEERLLRQRAGEVALIMSSLGENLQADVVSSTVAAQESNGDEAAFRSFVTEGEATDDSPETWVLLRRTPLGMEEVFHTGPPPLLPDNRREAVNRALVDAADGGFAIVALEGPAAPLQAIGVAAGRPGVPGDHLAYQELSLLQAAAGSNDMDSGFDDLGLELYLGDAPDPDRLILPLAMDDVRGPTVEERFEFGGQPLLLVVGATKPLTGDLTDNLPTILLVVAGTMVVLLTLVVELILRRRDRALRLVEQVEAQNRELDHAISEQRRSEEAKAALEEDLRRAQRLEAIGQLAGGIAHDFNNLLAAILGFAELAEEDLEGHESQADIIEIRRAAERGSALTEQLLTFSRRERGEPDDVDLNAVIEQVTSLLSRTIPADVELRIDLDPTLPAVLADAGELEQVLMNLVVNARDAMASTGGRIEIETSAEHLEVADLPAHPGMASGPVVRLVVRDDGVGMPPEVAARIFEPFFTTRERGDGTGLGLSTVYGIVQRSSGHIEVASEVGSGTTFVILFPASTEPPAPAEARVAGRAAAANEVVLVAEDEEPVRRATVRHLEAAGYRVREAADGATAIASGTQDDVDLLLTDLVMPGDLTGVDVADQITAARPGLPVIFMTGYSGDIPDDPRRDERAPLLRKPFTAQALLRAVAAALDDAARAATDAGRS